MFVGLGPSLTGCGKARSYPGASAFWDFANSEYMGAGGQVVADPLALGPEMADPSAWQMSTNGGSATATNSPSGTLNLTGDGTFDARGDYALTTVVGRTYSVTATVATNAASFRAGTSQGGTQLVSTTTFNAGANTAVFVATSTTSWVRFNRTSTGTSNVSAISVREVLTGLQYTRTGTGTAEDSSGVYASFSANTPRRTNKGLLVEEARTNKCTNTNANPQNLNAVTKTGDPASVLSVVDDSAALAAAGLSAFGPNVFKLDNTAGSSTAHAVVGGTVANTNPHVGTAFMRVAAGGTGDVRFNTGTVLGSTTSTGYQRVTGSRTPALSTEQLYISARAGSVVYFTLNQLEEGAFATSPILTTGAAGTRGADRGTVSGLTIPAAFTIFVDVTLPGDTGATQALATLSAAGSANDRLLLSRTSTGFPQITTVSGGSSTSRTGLVGKTGARRLKVAVAFEAGVYRIAADGEAIADLSATMPVGLNALDVGTTQAGAAALNGFERAVVLYPRAMSASELAAITA